MERVDPVGKPFHAVSKVIVRLRPVTRDAMGLPAAIDQDVLEPERAIILRQRLGITQDIFFSEDVVVEVKGAPTCGSLGPLLLVQRGIKRQASGINSVHHLEAANRSTDERAARDNR